MFTNPTELKMVPCSYYLEGECRFDDTKCRFSHGAIVHLSDLKEYKYVQTFSLLLEVFYFHLS